MVLLHIDPVTLNTPHKDYIIIIIIIIIIITTQRNMEQKK